MKFIKKKNFLEGEELLYEPRLHWMFIIKRMVQSLPFFLALFVLLVLWRMIGPNTGLFMKLFRFISFRKIRIAALTVFLAAVGIILLNFIWRILLYITTEYGITNKRLIIKKGIFRVVVTEIPIDRIEGIYCIQGILGRLFGYGTICVSGVGGLTPLLYIFSGMMPVFYMVTRPYALRRKIAEIIEKNKTINVVHGELPKAPPVSQPVPEEEPLYRYGTFVRVIPNDVK